MLSSFTRFSLGTVALSKKVSQKGDFPETEKQSKRILSLPINQFLKKQEIIYISNDKIKLEKGRLIKEKSWEEFRSFVVLEVETDQYNSNQFCFQSKGKRFYFGSFLMGIVDFLGIPSLMF